MSEQVKQRIEEANKKVLEIIKDGELVWIGDEKAINVVPGLEKNIIMHAGPPIEYERMAGAMKKAVLGAVIFEGFTADLQEAEEAVVSGDIELRPCHDFNTVGGMTGVTSPSMYVHIVRNEKYGNEAYCMPHEGGSFKGLGWGTNDAETINHVRWMQEELSPVLNAAVKQAGGVRVKQIIARAIQMGDECHSRCTAGTMIMTRMLAPYMMESDFSKATLGRVFEFLRTHDIFFLHVIMAAGRAMVEPAKNIPFSTVVTTFARNGIEFGIKVSALGDQWFTAPSPEIKTVFFSPEWSSDVATRDMGDSAITETIGLGGQITVCSPAQEYFLGGSYETASQKTLDMYEISTGENSTWAIPNFNFRGGPLGIDIRKVLQKGILPTIHTATAHVEGGFIGGGETNVPMKCFEDAMMAFARQYELEF